MISIFSLPIVHDEPYLTQILAYVLNRSPEYKSFFVDEILKSSNFGNPTKVIAEKRDETDRPDILLEFKNDIKIALELKINAPFGDVQLERYKKRYGNVFIIHKTLSNNQGLEKVHGSLTWFEVYEKTCQYLKRGNSKEKAEWCIEEFANYLLEEKLIMERVGWELINGTKALSNLAKQIEYTFDKFYEEGILKNYKIGSATATYQGWVVSGPPNLYVYLNYEPLMLLVSFYGSKKESQKHLTKLEPISSVLPELANWGGKNLYVDSYQFEKTFFFSLNAKKQVEEVHKFLKKSFKGFY